MNRRGFLKILGWSIPAGYVTQALAVNGFDEVVAKLQGPPPILPGDPQLLSTVDFETMTLRVATAMRDALGYPVAHAVDDDERMLGQRADAAIGDVVIPDPVMLSMQFGAASGHEIGSVQLGDSIRAADLDVYGVALAHEAKRQNLSVFAPLVTPRGVVAATNVRAEDGPTVRGVMAYDLYADRLVYRFDCLGGKV